MSSTVPSLPSSSQEDHYRGCGPPFPYPFPPPGPFHPGCPPPFPPIITVPAVQGPQGPQGPPGECLCLKKGPCYKPGDRDRPSKCDKKHPCDPWDPCDYHKRPSREKCEAGDRCHREDPCGYHYWKWGCPKREHRPENVHEVIVDANYPPNPPNMFPTLQGALDSLRGEKIGETGCDYVHIKIRTLCDRKRVCASGINGTVVITVEDCFKGEPLIGCTFGDFKTEGGEHARLFVDDTKCRLTVVGKPGSGLGDLLRKELPNVGSQEQFILWTPDAYGQILELQGIEGERPHCKPCKPCHKPKPCDPCGKDKLEVWSSLSGCNEVPTPNNSSGRGWLKGSLDTKTKVLQLTLKFEGLESPTQDVGDLSAAHIHEAPAGANGPVVFDLDLDAGLTKGCLERAFLLTDEQVAVLLAGGYYVNIHTTGFPAGEIRGQLESEKPHDSSDDDDDDSSDHDHHHGRNRNPDVVTLLFCDEIKAKPDCRGELKGGVLGYLGPANVYLPELKVSGAGLKLKIRGVKLNGLKIQDSTVSLTNAVVEGEIIAEEQANLKLLKVISAPNDCRPFIDGGLLSLCSCLHLDNYSVFHPIFYGLVLDKDSSANASNVHIFGPPPAPGKKEGEPLLLLTGLEMSGESSLIGETLSINHANQYLDINSSSYLQLKDVAFGQVNKNSVATRAPFSLVDSKVVLKGLTCLEVSDPETDQNLFELAGADVYIDSLPLDKPCKDEKPEGEEEDTCRDLPDDHCDPCHKPDHCNPCHKPDHCDPCHKPDHCDPCHKPKPPHKHKPFDHYPRKPEHKKINFAWKGPVSLNLRETRSVFELKGCKTCRAGHSSLTLIGEHWRVLVGATTRFLNTYEDRAAVVELIGRSFTQEKEATLRIPKFLTIIRKDTLPVMPDPRTRTIGDPLLVPVIQTYGTRLISRWVRILFQTLLLGDEERPNEEFGPWDAGYSLRECTKALLENPLISWTPRRQEGQDEELIFDGSPEAFVRAPVGVYANKSSVKILGNDLLEGTCLNQQDLPEPVRLANFSNLLVAVWAVCSKLTFGRAENATLCKKNALPPNIPGSVIINRCYKGLLLVCSSAAFCSFPTDDSMGGPDATYQVALTIGPFVSVAVCITNDKNGDPSSTLKCAAGGLVVLGPS